MSLTDHIYNSSPNISYMGKMLLLSCIAVIVYFVALFLKYSNRRKYYSKVLPGTGVRFFDFFGNASYLPRNEKARNGYPFNVFFLQLAGAFSNIYKKQKLFCFWMSYVPFVILAKAEAVEAILSGTKLMQKGFIYNFLHPWLGTGLLTSHGSKWKSRRKLLTPAFHFDILKDFLPVFNDQSQKLVKKLEKETNKSFTEINSHVTLCSLDIICETTLGVSVNAQDNKESEYVKAVSRASEIIMGRTVNMFHWTDFIFQRTESGKSLKSNLKLLHDFTRSVIQEKKRKLQSDAAVFSKKRKALMDVLLEHHIQTKSLTEEDIREEVDTFAFEGHDTTATGISWALYLIGLYKDVQEKVIEEIDSIFGSDLERPATTDDLKDMKYLDCVLKESQRLYPSVPMIARQVTEDQHICGYNIPKGATCIVLPFYLHRDEDVFPNPEKFDPERFLPENSVNRHPYAYIPFSAGPRNCIGQRFAVMEEKVVVSTVLRHYSLESLDERDKVVPSADLILRPVEPLRIRIRPRHTMKK